MSDQSRYLKSIRKWSHKQRVFRLGELRHIVEDDGLDWFDLQRLELYSRHDMRERLDEGVVILLEMFRSVFPGVSPFTLYESSLNFLNGLGWELMGMRMLESRVLIDEYKALSRDAQRRSALKRTLIERGLI